MLSIVIKLYLLFGELLALTSMTESCYIMHRVTTAEIQQNQSLLSEFDAIKHARFMSHATEINFKDNLIKNV